MAKKPAAPAVKKSGAYNEKAEALQCEARDRLDGCERQKQEWSQDIRESLFFAAPHLARDIKSGQQNPTSKPNDAGDRQTSIASELVRDFVTEVVNAFMPPADAWAEQRPGMFLPDEVKQEAIAAAKEQDPKIFDAIRASNLYEIVPIGFAPDLGIGTVGLWIDDPRPAENIVCQPVPLRELEINVGPYAEVDDRFAVRTTKNRYVKALLGTTIYGKVPAEKKAAIEKDGDASTVLRWGFWRLWDRYDDVVWQHVVMIDRDVVHETLCIGEGSCPLLVARFNPCAQWAYAPGPLIESLEDLRLLDALEGDKIDHIELKLRPPTGYPDDSFAAVENGIESGSAYPIRAGSADAIKPIFDGGDIEGALFETQQIEERLRRRFFLGFPNQRGKTPPTATQWIDEMIEAQRRIGTPGMPFWREGPAQIFLRFKFLLAARGIIQPIKVNGKTVALTPYNPAQRAAEQQEVAMAARFIQLVAGAFPEEFRMKVDGSATMEAIKEKMRAVLINFRKKDDQQAAVEQISKLIEGRQQIRPASSDIAGPT